MTAHIDTLNEWYENAERITRDNIPKDGDTIIYPGPGEGSYIVEPNTEGWEPQIVYEDEECRILARAPKPKPAWHDAPAVIASTDYGERQVWERGTTHENWWYGTAGDGAATSDLRDVTPLIEAKVTGEMVKRGSDWAMDNPMHGDGDMRLLLTAALGLETE